MRDTRNMTIGEAEAYRQGFADGLKAQPPAPSPRPMLWGWGRTPQERAGQAQERS